MYMRVHIFSNEITLSSPEGGGTYNCSRPADVFASKIAVLSSVCSRVGNFSGPPPTTSATLKIYACVRVNENKISELTFFSSPNHPLMIRTYTRTLYTTAAVVSGREETAITRAPVSRARVCVVCYNFEMICRKLIYSIYITYVYIYYAHVYVV